LILRYVSCEDEGHATITGEINQREFGDLKRR
jgi:hypothetical protein